MLNFLLEIRLEFLRKKAFEKGYRPRWTEEIFTVSAVQPASPVTYKIIDYKMMRSQEHSMHLNYRKLQRIFLG